MLNCLACIEKLRPDVDRSEIVSVLIAEIVFCEVLWHGATTWHSKLITRYSSR